jgi:heptosyltransferase-1
MARILFVKTSSLGDVVHNCPAVSDAARALPGVEIDWVVEEPFAQVAKMHPAVRRVITVAVRRWRSALWNPAVWREMRDVRRAIAAERYAAVIDTQSLLKSALIASWASGPKHGLDGASAREPLAARFYDHRHAVTRDLHAVERNRRLTAAALGRAVPATLDYGLKTDASDSGAWVFLTMTSRDDKLWPEERWIELGRALRGKVVLPWGSEAERLRAERIAAALPDGLVLPRQTIHGLASLFSSARGVVGVDTGLTHLAAAVGARTVGIYCGSDPALTGIYGAPRSTNLGSLGNPPNVAEVLKALS